MIFKSPYASGVNLVLKEDRFLRLRIDCRKLSQSVIVDSFPLPHMTDLFKRMESLRWFSVIDLKSGYSQIPLDEKSRKLSAFRTPDWLYE